MSRTVVWFSAGAASAVAAKLILTERDWLLEHDEIVLAYTDTRSEHPDNARFIAECEQWFGHEVLRLRSQKYQDIWDVFRRERFLNSPWGAPCTGLLKKAVRYEFQRPTDVQVFGYTAEERKRADRFREQNPEVDLETPLIDRGLTKQDCLGILAEAAIRIPVMYLLGYQNNNCVGCVKGGIGYWNKIRVDFPDVFDRMAKLEREIGASILKEQRWENGKRVSYRLFLDELDPSRGNHATEPSFECSLLCSATADEIA